MKTTPSAMYSITIRLQVPNVAGMLGKVASTIGKTGGNIGSVDIVRVEGGILMRDITVSTVGVEHAQKIVTALKCLKDVDVVHVTDRTFRLHEGGKITVANRAKLDSRELLSMAYTPGVARVCMAIHKKPALAYNFTIKRNTVAIVTDGTAVLGLGDIGPEAALPVMEGKAMLFKEFGGVDAFPVCLDTKDPDEIIRTVKYIAPEFGGINLEDISAPRCFYVEEKLRKELPIPVFHDDQHGTAVVVLAALTNALKLVKKDIRKIKVAVCGAGAAGTACTKIMLASGCKNIVCSDIAGIVYKGRKENMNPMLEWLAEQTNPDGLQGTVSDAIKGADVFVGVSAPNVITVADLKKMARDPIVFAMANPDPEIPPEKAVPYVRIMATGRSDYPNQINNVLCFPGLFRGALDCLASAITEEMKLAAAKAIASIIKDDELNEDYIIPSVFNKKVAKAVAAAVTKEAIRAGIAHRKRHIRKLYAY